MIDIKELDVTLNNCKSKIELEELKDRTLYSIKMGMEYNLPEKLIQGLYEFAIKVENKLRNI
jgi:hypothetical protein